MSITTSLHIGLDVNHEHNTSPEYREELSHVKHELTKENVTLKDIYTEYGNYRKQQLEAFKDYEVKNGSHFVKLQDVLNEYNKGKKPSRQKSIEDLFEEKTSGRRPGETLSLIREREILFQVGNELYGEEQKIFLDTLSRDQQRDILIETFEQFQEDFKGEILITQAVIHMDETTPHLHLDYIICQEDRDKKRGLKLNFTQDKWAKSHVEEKTRETLKNESKNDTEFSRKCYKAFYDRLDRILIEKTELKGETVENPHLTAAQHMNTNAWREMNEEAMKKAREKEAEIKALKEAKTDREKDFQERVTEIRKSFKEELTRLKNEFERRVKEMFEQNKNLEKENTKLRQENEFLKEDLKKAVEENRSLAYELYERETRQY